MRYMWYVDSKKLVRYFADEGKLEWYNPSTTKWEKDTSLYEVFTGDVDYDMITEEEAWKKLESLK